MRVHLIRRAKAGRRGGERTEALRPLSEEGAAQARGLAESMDGERIDRIVASPYQRCIQTALPLAERRGLEIEIDERLAEGTDATQTLNLLRSFGDTATAVFTHSDVIRKLLTNLAPRTRAGGKKLRRRKASAWLLEGDLDGKLKAAYRPPPSRVDDDPVRVAVLDLGSTSFHLLVGDVGADGSIERVTRERDMLRLGALVSKHAHIPDADCERAIESVLHLSNVAESANAEVLIAIATAAFREARNGRKLAKLLGRELGTKVRVLSGGEEARTIFSAFRRRVGLGPKAELGLDLGGGSLELAIGDANDVSWESTQALGAVRLHRDFAGDSVDLSSDAAEKLRRHVIQQMQRVSGEVRAHAPERCIGTGGTVRSLARLSLARGPQLEDNSLLGAVLSTAQIADLAAHLRATNHDERLAMPGMDARRADILPAGALIVATVLEELGIPNLTVCDWGLREGIMLDAVREPRRHG